jgi:hypothetical protein
MTAAMAGTSLMPDENLARPERMPVRATGRRLVNPLALRGLYEVTDIRHTRNSTPEQEQPRET